MKKFKKINDPGHGWLSVSLKDLKNYGLIDKVSPYSYMSLTRAYLEEDCDMGIFENYLKENHIQYEVKESHVEKSPIRNMASFDKSKVSFALNIKVGDQIRLYSSQSNRYSNVAEIVEENKSSFVLKDLYGNKYNAPKLTILSNIEVQKPKTFSVLNENGKAILNVRLVEKNDNYGSKNCLTHEDDVPLIEFYDNRYPHTDYGQFISRYNLDTFVNANGEGINLYGGEKDWVLPPEGEKKIKKWLDESYPRLVELSKSKPKFKI